MLGQFPQTLGAAPVWSAVMGEPAKIRYEIDLRPAETLAAAPTPAGPGVSLRQVSASDGEALADLMLDSYRGTIDYDGEDLDDARAEVSSFLRAEPSLAHSVIAEVGTEVASAVLVARVDRIPLVAYVMTRSGYKGRGLGRLVVRSALERLAADGHETVELFITEGNTASERLFQSVGAVPRPG